MMSGFEEITFKAVSAGGGNIPFADEDASTIPSTPGQCNSAIFSTEDLTYPEINFGEDGVKKLSNFRGPLLKSCTESSVPTTRFLQGLKEANLALKKSRTDGCVPLGNKNHLQRYEDALSRYKKPEIRGKAHQNERENGHGYSSSDDSVVRNKKSKSTNSIDARSVNNILDQYEELDYRRSSDLSDVGNVDVTNFEATMNMQKQREVSRLKKPAVPAPPIEETNPKQSAGQTESKSSQKIVTPLTKKLHEAEDEHRVNTEVEILLRKGEVQKRVDEWLSQTQNQNFKVSKDRGLVRSNSSSCYRYRSGDSRSKPRAGNEPKETLNVALSCDELNNEKGEIEEDLTLKTERKQIILDKVSVGVNTSRGPYKEYLATRNKARQNNEQGTPGSAAQRITLISKIPQRGNPNSSYLAKKIEAKNTSGEQERDKTRNGPLAIPTRRSSLKRITSNGGAGGGEVGSKVWANAKGLAVSELVTTAELQPALPNKDRESRRPLIAREDKPDGGSPRSIETSVVSMTLRHEEFHPEEELEQQKTVAHDTNVPIKNKDLDGHLPATGSVSLKMKSFQGSSEDRESCLRGPPVPRKVHNPTNSNGTSNYVKCTRLVNPVSSFKPNNAMYATLQGDEDSDTFATSLGNESVTRSHYATPKQIEKIYERPRLRRDPPSQVIHADDLEAVLKTNTTSTVSAYGDKSLGNSRQKERSSLSSMIFGASDEDIYAQVGDTRCSELLETIMEDQRKEGCQMHLQECGFPGPGDLSNLERRFGTVQKTGNGNSKAMETIYASPRTAGIKQFSEQSKNTFTTFRSPAIREENLSRSSEPRQQSIVPVDCKISSEDEKLDRNLDANSLYESRIGASKMSAPVKSEDTLQQPSPLVNGSSKPEPETVLEDSKTDKEKPQAPAPVVNAILLKTLRFEQDLPAVKPRIDQTLTELTFAKNSFNSRDVLSDDYGNVLLQDSMKMKEEKLYVTKEEMEHEKLMDLLRKGDFEAAKSELERSYTLSTPGGGSPICCPPCSPPPAPTAYISSARASSRRLGVGGPTSPERDPLGRLLRFLKTFYRELGTRDPPHLPAWAAPLPLGTLCPAHFQPHLQLIHKSEQEHRLENIKLDQIFAPVRLSDGSVSEAPRRVAIEGGPGSGRTTLCLRLLHQWATQLDGGSPALAFIVPLRELRGSLLLNYLSRELLPRTSALGDAVAQVWRTLHLMEDRVLFVLDGYDECVGGRASLGDAVDLLEGRLFPDARILVTCSPRNSPALSPLVQRRINLAGLEWPHVERLCAAYFIHNDIAERVREFLEVLNAQPHPVRQLGQHPLGWIMLCALYQDSGNLPDETSALVQAAVKCIVKRSLDPPVSYTEEIPGHCRKRLEDFGRLSLAALREGRCCYTEAELRARGGGLEVTRLGFLTRGLTFGQRRKPDLFTPIHSAVAEFLAAYYLTSVAQYANILRRELEGLPTGIIGHLAGLLGPKTHLILNQLCPLEVPPRAVFSLLKSAGSSDGNIAAVCRLVGAGPGFGPAPNEPRSAPLVHTVPLELEGWARILESSACTLEALEIVFQVERGSDPRYLDDFFEALATNESVKLVRITSLLGHEFPADEAQRLARHLKSVLGKKRLNDFELVITCLEESAHDRLECVVSALCRGLTLASPQLARLVLDMNLSGEQVSRVCEALRSCVQVQALHLPHLGCGREGLASVAELLKERPLLALNLAGSWGAKNEDPSSSGISMGSGSGSGSSGCASSTLGTLPLNRCYSSLPRGAPTVYGSLTRPATLPRLPLGLGPVPIPSERDNGSKRNSDSVLCHRLPLLHPLPTCDLPSHQGTGFHEIFSAIREPSCKLRSLNVSKCLLGSLDAGCLAETIRRARHLDALRAAGASRPADMMPLVLALTEAPCLQLLDLASPRLALDDHPSRLLCHALARNSTLKLLSLEGWTFRIEESDSLSVFSELLRCTSVRELSLCNARLHLAVHEGPLSRLGRRDDAGAELLRAAAPPACPAIVFLRLAGFQVTVNDRLALRGPLLLPFLGGFTALSELDLSLDKSTIGGSSGSLLFIDDKMLINFFSCLSSNFKNLQSLRINFWRITLEDCDRTMRQISKYLKACNMSFLKMNGLIVTDSVKKVQIEHSFLNTVLTNLQYLTWLCLDGIELNESQSAVVGKCLRDRFPGSSLEISAKDVNVKSVKALVASVEDGGRAEVVYTGGAHCRLRIAKVQKNGKHKKK